MNNGISQEPLTRFGKLFARFDSEYYSGTFPEKDLEEYNKLKQQILNNQAIVERVKDEITRLETLLSIHQKECVCFACSTLEVRIKSLQSLLQTPEQTQGLGVKK